MKINALFGPSYKNYEIGEVVRLGKQQPLHLSCGKTAHDFPVAYQIYGELNAERSNAILLCHGLTADQYAASTHPVTGKPGWWEMLIGPGNILDTNRYAIICSNVIGGCMGSWGPKEAGPDGTPLALDFPVITVADMVEAQYLLLEHLGIRQLAAVIGGSMGGMLALGWAVHYPDKMRAVILMATAARHSAQNIAFHEIGRQAVMADPEWRQGRYQEEKTFPVRGLAVARMTAHVTYLSEQGLQQKFGRKLQNRENFSFGFEADFKVESYLRHQGKSFVKRFDPNSYLYITRAMDYFDLAAEHDGRLSNAFRGSKARFCVIAFTSDWLYPPAESRAIVKALNGAAANVSYVVIESDKGHDAFLLENEHFFRTLKGFLGSLD